MCWDGLTMVLIIFSTVTVPVNLAFDIVDDDFFNISEWIVNALFLLDILIVFRTGVIMDTMESEELIIYDPYIIARLYLKSWFLLDLAASVPIDELFPTKELSLLPILKALRPIRLIRLIRLIKLSRFVKRLNEDGVLSPTLIRISTLLFMLVFAAHLLGCAFFAVGAYIHADDQSSWVTQYQIKYSMYDWASLNVSDDTPLRDQMARLTPLDRSTIASALTIISQPLLDQPVGERWFTSFYWALTTMSTVGYGDVYPANHQERLFVLLAELCGVVFFGYITSSIQHLTATSNRKLTKIDQQLEMMNSHLVQRGASRDLRRRCYAFFEYYYTHKKMFSMPTLLDELTTNLREEVALHEFSDYLRVFPALRLEKRQDFKIALCIALEPFVSLAEEYVVFAGVISQDMFFIFHGIVQLLSPDESVSYGLMSDGGCFGLHALRPGSDCTPYSVQAKICTHFLYLSSSAFDGLAANFPDAYIRLSAFLGIEYNATRKAASARKTCTCSHISHGVLHHASSDFGDSAVAREGPSAVRDELSVIRDEISAMADDASFACSHKEHQRNGQAQTRVSTEDQVGCALPPLEEGIPNPSPPPSPPPMHHAAPPNSRPQSWLSICRGLVPFLRAEKQPVRAKSVLRRWSCRSSKGLDQVQLPRGRRTDASEYSFAAGGPAQNLRRGEARRASISSFVKRTVSYALDRHNFAFNNIPMSVASEQLDAGPLRLSRDARREYQRNASRTSITAGTMIDAMQEAAVRTKNKWVILPSNPWKVRWDILVGILTIYSCTMLPYRIGLGDEARCRGDNDSSPSCAFFIFDTVTDFIFLLDIVFTFFTSVRLRSGELAISLRKIAHCYLTSTFWSDLLSSFPMNLVFFLALDDTEDAQALRLIRLIRLTRILRLLRLLKLQNFFIVAQRELGLNKAVTQLFELFLRILYVLHCAGCLWYMLISFDVTNFSLPATGERKQLSWGVSSQFLDLGCKELGFCEPRKMHAQRYLTSVYWAFTTLSTIGFGDIVPNADTEKAFACLLMLIGPIMLGYILSRITDLVGSIDVKGSRRRLRFLKLKAMFRDALMPKELRLRLQVYFSKYLSEGSDYIAEQGMLMQLPPPLKLEVILFLCKHMIQNIALFQGQDPAFVVSVCKTLNPMFAAPGDYLFREGAVANEMFFLQSGSVEMVREAMSGMAESILERLDAVCHFGEVALFLEGERREASVRAVTFCCLYTYSRTQFHSMVKFWPSAHENLKADANKRLLQVKPLQRLRRIFRVSWAAYKLANPTLARPERASRRNSNEDQSASTFGKRAPGDYSFSFGEDTPQTRRYNSNMQSGRLMVPRRHSSRVYATMDASFVSPTPEEDALRPVDSRRDVLLRSALSSEVSEMFPNVSMENASRSNSRRASLKSSNDLLADMFSQNGPEITSSSARSRNCSRSFVTMKSSNNLASDSVDLSC